MKIEGEKQKRREATAKKNSKTTYTAFYIRQVKENTEKNFYMIGTVQR